MQQRQQQPGGTQPVQGREESRRLTTEQALVKLTSDCSDLGMRSPQVFTIKSGQPRSPFSI